MKVQQARKLGTRLAALAAVAFAMVASAAIAASVPTVVGDWQGAISANGGSMRVVLHVAQGEDGKLTATLDSPDQGAMGIPIDTITFKQPDLHFEIQKFSASFDGKMNSENSEISGQWKQGSAALPLNFKRAGK